MVIGYTFVKWDRDFSNITASLEVKAVYKPNVYEVRFLDGETLIGEAQHILHGENALAPNPPMKPDYRFLKWSHSYENIKQNLDITALYELSFTQADMMMELRTLKTLIQQVNVLDGLLKDLPANEYYIVEDTLNKLKTDIENIESALLSATTEEDILAISKSIEKASQEYNLSVVKGEKIDEPNPDDPNPDDPEDPVKPKQGLNTTIIVISVIGALVFVGVIIRMVFRFKK